MSDRPHLLNTSEAAEALGVSNRQIQRLVAAGKLAKIRVGGSTRFDPLDLELYIGTNRRVIGRRRVK